VLLAGAIIAFRFYIVSHLEKAAFVTYSSATATPAKFHVPYTPFSFKSGTRTLRGWRIGAGPKTPAVLIFHGNAQTIHDWAHIQAYLFHHGISSMIFDYSGFGASTGRPTVERLNQDALAAYRVFVQWVGPKRAKFVLGHSLGTAVLLHNAHDFKPAPLGVIVYGAFNTAGDLMVYRRLLPAYLKPIAPDVWDSVRSVKQLSVPLLVLAGSNDATVPPRMGRQVAFNARSGEFAEVWSAGHDAILEQPFKRVWVPIFKFMRRRVMAARRTKLKTRKSNLETLRKPRATIQ
jgi:alpha-beta hydrolase superfamily lysophospholipase